MERAPHNSNTSTLELHDTHQEKGGSFKKEGGEILRNPLARFTSGVGRLISKTKERVSEKVRAWRDRSEEEHRITMITDEEERSRAFAQFYNASESSNVLRPKKVPVLENSPQKIRTPDILNFEEKLNKVDENTEKFSERVTEGLQHFGKKLLTYLKKGKGVFSSLEKGAYYLDKNVDKKVKLFASGGLIAAGAFAGFAAPAVITAIGVAGIGMRIVSTATTYKVLNDAYKKWELNNNAASSLKKISLKTGTIVGAAFMGQVAGAAVSNLGDFFEKLSPSEMYEKGAQIIKDILPPSYDPIVGKGDYVPYDPNRSVGSVITKDLFNLHGEQVVNSTLPVENPPTPYIEQSPVEPQPDVKQVESPQIHNPELMYEIKRGDTLWSALRKTLTGVNFQEFSTLSSGAQEHTIRALISKIEEDPAAYGIRSGNINLIRSGDTLDFTKLVK